MPQFATYTEVAAMLRNLAESIERDTQQQKGVLDLEKKVFVSLMTDMEDKKSMALFIAEVEEHEEEQK